MQTNNQIIGEVSRDPISGDLVGQVAGQSVTIRPTDRVDHDGQAIFELVAHRLPERETVSRKTLDGGCVLHILPRGEITLQRATCQPGEVLRLSSAKASSI
jgi:hypothetical protein